jgi:hypothetical protein
VIHDNLDDFSFPTHSHSRRTSSNNTNVQSLDNGELSPEDIDLNGDDGLPAERITSLSSGPTPSLQPTSPPSRP